MAGKVNKPNPTNVHFLFENPRFINEPVCHASTKAVKNVQHSWWPDEVSKEVKLKPAYSLNSTNRSDFGDIPNRPPGISRFSCLEGKRTAASGIVPVTKLPTSTIKTEKISYEHIFDSRKERTERGKLHGAFVWDTTSDTQARPTRRYAKRYFEEMDTLNMSEEIGGSLREGPTSGTECMVPQQVEIPSNTKEPRSQVGKKCSDKQIGDKKFVDSAANAKIGNKPMGNQHMEKQMVDRMIVEKQISDKKSVDRKDKSGSGSSSNHEHNSASSSQIKSKLKVQKKDPASPPPHIF